jgi:hypothetical protein
LAASFITEAPSRFQINASAAINRSMHLMIAAADAVQFERIEFMVSWSLSIDTGF